MIRLAPAAIAASLIVLAGAATAQDAGRFAFGADGEAVLRIDTVTGAVSRCLPATEGWLCTPVATAAGPDVAPTPVANPADPGADGELARMAAILAGLQEAVAALAARPVDPGVAPAVEALRLQLEALAAAQQVLTANLARATGPTVIGPPAPDIEPRLAAIETAIGALGGQVAAMVAAPPAPADLGPAVEALRQQVEALATAQQVLTTNLARVAGPTVAGPPAPDLDPRLAAIETAIGALGEQVAAIATRDDLVLPALADLVQRQQAVTSTIAALPQAIEMQLTPLLAVQSQQTGFLRETIMDLFGARQIEAAATNTALAEQLTRIEGQIAALPIADPAAAAALATQIETLAQRLTEANGTFPPEIAALLATLHDQQTAMDARLATLAAAQPALTDTIGALAAQIAATMADDAETARVLAAITEGVLGLRQDVAVLATLGGAAPEAGTLTAIGDRLAAIETQLQALDAAGDRGLAAALATLTDRLGALETRISAVPPALDAVTFNEAAGALRTDIGTLQQAVATVAQTIATPDPAIEAIRSQLADLVAAQQALIARLPERIAATPEVLAATEGLRTQLQALEARISGMGTAEQATAVLGALGMIVEGQAGIETALTAAAAPPTGDIVGALDGMTRRLADLEAIVAAAPAPLDTTATLAALGDRLAAIEGRLATLATPSNGDAVAALRTDILGLRDQLAALAAPAPAADLAPLVNQLLEQQRAVAEAIRVLADEIAELRSAAPPAAADIPPRADAQPATPAADGFGENLMQRLFGLAEDLRGGLN